LCALLACVLTGCTRDPNARKQKYFDSGEKYFTQGKYREAAIQYSNALQIDPRFAQAHFQLSQSYLRIGDSQRAFQELTRTVELAPDNYRAHLDLANLLMTVRAQDGSPDPDTLKQAKAHLDLLRQKEPNTAETHQSWSNYYATQNKLPDAIQEMQQAIALDPSRSDPYLMLALLQLRSNQLDAAEASIKKATATDPKPMNAQLALGTFYQSHGRVLEAEQQFRDAIEVDPKNPDARASLVRVFLQEGKKDEIEPLLQKTKKDLPDDPRAYRMLGDYYFAEGDLDKALTEYSSIYNEYPKDVTAKKNYIQLLILKNRVDEASKLTAELLKTGPNDSDSLIYKGEIQMRQNDVAGALQSFQSALKNDPGNAIGHYQLGNAYAQQKDSSRAESEWREAVRLRPSLVEAQHSLAGVEIDRADYTALLQTAQQIITFNRPPPTASCSKLSPKWRNRSSPTRNTTLKKRCSARQIVLHHLCKWEISSSPKSILLKPRKTTARRSKRIHRPRKPSAAWSTPTQPRSSTTKLFPRRMRKLPKPRITAAFITCWEASCLRRKKIIPPQKPRCARQLTSTKTMSTPSRN